MSASLSEPSELVGGNQISPTNPKCFTAEWLQRSTGLRSASFPSKTPKFEQAFDFYCFPEPESHQLSIKYSLHKRLYGENLYLQQRKLLVTAIRKAIIPQRLETIDSHHKCWCCSSSGQVKCFHIRFRRPSRSQNINNLYFSRDQPKIAHI